MKEKEETTENWTLEELTSMTDEVQQDAVLFKEKNLAYQYCELTAAEEPSFGALEAGASEEQKMEYYTKIGSERILTMLEKANEKNPEGPCISKETWELLPTTLRYSISNQVMGVKEDVAANFTL
jgi:hypothetical protein